MQEVEDIADRWTQPLDGSGCQLEHLFFQGFDIGRLQTGIQELTKPLLVGFVLIDVGNAELGLPVEGMGGAFEHLLLFGNAAENKLQGGALKVIGEATILDVFDNGPDTTSNATKSFQALFIADEPGVVHRFGVCLVSLGSRQEQLSHDYGEVSESAGELITDIGPEASSATVSVAVVTAL